MPNHPIFRTARNESRPGFVQHVESTDEGDLRKSDWYDSDRTLVSYSHGREFHRSSTHPLLARHQAAMNEEQAESDKERQREQESIREPEWRRRAREGNGIAKDTTNG